MQGSVTVSMAAPPEKVWDLIADVRNIGKYSPETFEA
ncbi:cyclase, partial [Mycobacterium sp. ITM-2017-0098]